MNCVKCGREIPEDQVFCEICLTEMENYPVKPGTVVHIPARTSEAEPVKKKKKHIPTTEERLAKAQKKLRRTRGFAVVLLLICGTLSFLLGQTVLELDWQRLLGQNYKTTGIRPAGIGKSGFVILPTAPASPAEEAIAPAQPEQPESSAEPEQMPAAPVTEPPTEPATQAPTEIVTEPPTEVPTAEPTEVPTAAPTEPPSEASTEQPTEQPAEPPTEASTESATTAVEPTAEPGA